MAFASPELLDPSRYPFRHEITTRYADVDPNRHINNVAMVTAFEDARTRFLMTLPSHETHEVRTMIVANHVDYLRESYYPDLLIMHIGGLSIGRSSFTLACLAAQGTQVCAFARAVMVCTQNGRPVSVSEAYRGALASRMIAS